MCQQLTAIRAALVAFGASFVVPGQADEAMGVVNDAAAIESCAGALKSMAAAVAVEGAARTGGRSPTDALADVLGVGTGSARDVVATGRRLAQQPRLSAAARAGRLSREQVAIAADAAAAVPEAEGHLLAGALAGSLASLRELARSEKAAHRDPEAARRAIRARRSLRSWVDTEGAWHLNAVGNPEDGAQVAAAIEPYRTARFAAGRRSGEHDRPDAYGFDALVDLARAAASRQGTDVRDLPGSCPADGDGGPAAADAGSEPSAGDAGGGPGTFGPAGAGGQGREAGGHGIRAGEGAGEATAAGGDERRGVEPDGPAPATRGTKGRSRGAARRPRGGAAVKLLVRIDYDTWLRGVPTSGETCELVGFGPIAVSAVRELVEQGDPFVAAILTKGKDLVGVAHLGRRPNAYQQSALEWLYPSCAVEHCTARAHLEADHREDWARTRFTMLDLLDLLCHRHHALKTRSNWALVPGTGKRAFVPPSDPRHPRYRRGGWPATSEEGDGDHAPGTARVGPAEPAA